MGWLPQAPIKPRSADRQVLPEEPTSQRDDRGSIVRWVKLSGQHRHSHSSKDCPCAPLIRRDRSEARLADRPERHTANRGRPSVCQAGIRMALISFRRCVMSVKTSLAK